MRQLLERGDNQHKGYRLYTNAILVLALLVLLYSFQLIYVLRGKIIFSSAYESLVFRYADDIALFILAGLPPLFSLHPHWPDSHFHFPYHSNIQGKWEHSDIASVLREYAFSNYPVRLFILNKLLLQTEMVMVHQRIFPRESAVWFKSSKCKRDRVESRLCYVSKQQRMGKQTFAGNVTDYYLKHRVLHFPFFSSSSYPPFLSLILIVIVALLFPLSPPPPFPLLLPCILPPSNVQ